MPDALQVPSVLTATVVPVLEQDVVPAQDAAPPPHWAEPVTSKPLALIDTLFPAVQKKLQETVPPSRLPDEQEPWIDGSPPAATDGRKSQAIILVPTATVFQYNSNSALPPYREMGEISFWEVRD